MLFARSVFANFVKLQPSKLFAALDDAACVKTHQNDEKYTQANAVEFVEFLTQHCNFTNH